jgi:hypothetical protein
MKTVTVTLKASSPYSQSRYHNTERLEQESHEAYEARTWREKGHYTKDGEMYIPPMALKKSLDKAVKFRKRKGPNGGASTWTKHFHAGIMITDLILLGVQKEDVAEWGNMMDSNGKKDSGTRVYRSFPEAHDWEAEAIIYILDDAITEAVFADVLGDAGKFIGIGRFRPENGGNYGRFSVENITWN